MNTEKILRGGEHSSGIHSTRGECFGSGLWGTWGSKVGKILLCTSRGRPSEPNTRKEKGRRARREETKGGY